MTLTCEIFLYENGPPLQEILWMKDGTDIDIARSGGKYLGGSISDPSLVILDVSQFDKGSYQCKGSNAVRSTLDKVIVLDIPDIDVEGPATPQNDVQIFTAIVRSIPAPSKAHWLVKPEGQNEWISININSDEYRGTTNSLPQPVLVVKSKNRIENQGFKIEVTNFIGTNTKLIPVKRKMSIDGTEEDQQGSVTKGPRIDIEDDIQTELKANETGRLDQKDPLSDLTKDQRVALYTLLLCDGIRGVYVDDDVTMGDIDVRRILSELEEKGLITRDEASVEIPSNQYEKIMRFYRENCLLSDIDKDFYIQVASNESLHIYADVYLRQSAEKEKPEDIPIKLLRLVLEGRAKDAGMSIPEKKKTRQIQSMVELDI
ncbi:uncharacterized protein LOC125674433 [Ostrea edulis]|uniref:uncharacterized protein LOC125674433 n=1 Tax=Ostrea edulis TaxID=37623 RepID=UPI0024AF5B47|nr:uncharacterized protein LOC125674433 [Ostrea edulis]